MKAFLSYEVGHQNTPPLSDFRNPIVVHQSKSPSPTRMPSMMKGFEKGPWLTQQSQRCKLTTSPVPILWRDAALGWKTRALQRRSHGNGTVSLHQCSSQPCVSAGLYLGACERGTACRLYVSCAWCVRVSRGLSVWSVTEMLSQARSLPSLVGTH